MISTDRLRRVTQEEKESLLGMIGKIEAPEDHASAMICNACSCDCACICDCDYRPEDIPYNQGEKSYA